MTTLTNGNPVSSSVSSGQWVYYDFVLPVGSINLSVEITTTNNADLYVRQGSQPTLVDYDWSNARTGSNDEAIWTAVGDSKFQPGTIYYVGIYGGGGGSNAFQVTANWSSSPKIPTSWFGTQAGQLIWYDFGKSFSLPATPNLGIDPSYHIATPFAIATNSHRLVAFARIEDGDDVFMEAGLYHSDNGVTWTKDIDIESNILIYQITHINGAYFACGKITINSVPRSIIFRSTNGIKWTLVADINFGTGVSPAFGRVVYGNNLYMVAPHGYTAASVHYATSTDGINWTQRLMSFSFTDVAFGSGYFVVSSMSNGIYRGTNAIAWTFITSGIKGYFLFYDFNGYFFAVNNSDGKTYLGQYGTNWFEYVSGTSFSGLSALSGFYDHFLAGFGTSRAFYGLDNEFLWRDYTLSAAINGLASKPLDWNPFEVWTPTTPVRASHHAGYVIAPHYSAIRRHHAGYTGVVRASHRAIRLGTSPLRASHHAGRLARDDVAARHRAGFQGPSIFRHHAGHLGCPIAISRHSAGLADAATINARHRAGTGDCPVVRARHVAAYAGCAIVRHGHRSGVQAAPTIMAVHRAGLASCVVPRASQSAGRASSGRVTARHRVGLASSVLVRGLHRSGRSSNEMVRARFRAGYGSGPGATLRHTSRWSLAISNRQPHRAGRKNDTLRRPHSSCWRIGAPPGQVIVASISMHL